VSKVSKLSQMNQLLRRGKRKGWAEYSPQHFKSLRKMIVDMVGGWKASHGLRQLKEGLMHCRCGERSAM
jgi:hypothetical protein